MIKHATIFVILGLLVLAAGMPGPLAAQSATDYQWFDPAGAPFPVIDGRGWQTGLANPYDRLPAKAEQTVRSAVWSLSRNGAGEYISFKTSANSITVRFKVSGSHAMPHMPATGVSGVDLYAQDVNGQWQWARGRYSFGDTIEYRFSNLLLSAREEEFRLYLPLYNTVTWMNIGVPKGATFSFREVSREKPIVLYGTSIMQGGCASRPGLAWTNILGRKLDRTLINLGFSGNGQLEEPVISLINEVEASLYVLDCMPNLSGRGAFSKEEVLRRIMTSVSTLQARHPQAHILLVEHSVGLPEANMDTSMLNSARASSKLLAEAYASLRKEGVKQIHILTNEALALDKESTVDGVHPNDIGMMKHAEAYEKIIRSILHEETGKAGTTVPVRQRRDYATYDFMQRHEAVLKTVRTKQPRLVLIGNSITHFWGGQPEAASRQRGVESWNKYFEPRNAVNLGFGWDRIENVLWRVHHGELDGYKAEKIILTIGTNNLAAGSSEEEITEGLQHLVKAIQLRQPSATCLLSGIYPRRGMEARIAALNAKIRELANSLKVWYIDPGVVLLGPDKKIQESFFSDGLHPNAQGYEKLGEAIARSLKE